MKFESFSEKQLQALTWWSDASPYRDWDAIICDGAVRSGKTLCMGISFLCWAMRRFDGERFALCGKTITSLRRNVIASVLPVMRDLGFTCREKISQNLFTLEFGGRRNTFHLFGGQHEGSPALIQGITLAGVLLDEVALMPRSFVEQALARCSVSGSKFWFNCNPEGPQHWFYLEWIRKAAERQALYLHFTLEDNPSLSRRVIARYRDMYSGVFYRRFVLGEWVAPRGLIYDFFDGSQVCAPPPEEELSEFAVSCDYGTKNPSSFGLWGKSGETWYRLREYYYDSRPSALLLQVLIEGSQSVGKSFAADIERLIMDSTLKARDQEQRRLEQEYREKKKRRKANEKLEEEPQTTIRVIPATISKTVLVKRADFYQRILGSTLSFWMFAEELAQVTDAGKQGYSNLRTIMRTAFDYGSLFGIDFASDNSYSAIVDINICSMFCTTPSALDDYMDRKAIEGGNITRCIRCELSDNLGADGAIFRPYSPEQMETISRTLDRIMADTYTPEGALQPEKLLDMSWLDRTVRSWCQQKGHEASLTGSTSLDVFRKRSSVSAFRVAALCYYLYLLEACPGGDAGVRTDANDYPLREFPRWLRLPLSRLGIIQVNLASALAAPSVRTSAIKYPFQSAALGIVKASFASALDCTIV